MRGRLLGTLIGTAALAAVVGPLASPTPAHACPWHKSRLAWGFWWPAFEPPPPAGNAAAPTSLPVEGLPGDVGQWLAPQPWQVIAIHAALLPTGEVLHYSYPAGGAGSRVRLWNPTSGAFTDVDMTTDIFCSGLSLLADGRLLTTGGNDYDCTFQGRFDTHTFDPFGGGWSQGPDMSVGRWYPSNVALPDGRVLILSGLDRTCDTTPVMERYTPGQGLEVIPEGERLLALYPRLFLLSSGRVAHVGPEENTYVFDPAAPGWQFVDDMSTDRYDGFALLLPGETDVVMSCGGSGAAVTDTCERIDFKAPSPQWQSMPPMTLARSHANAVILPDRRVLVVGGGTSGLYESPMLNAEIFDPDADSWTLLPAQVHGRMYHSTAVLVPDGRVVSAGQDNGLSGDFGEIYEPDYLFAGPRPTIAAAPSVIRYGSPFVVSSPQASAIARVALIGLTTQTHSINTGQLYVGLSFTLDGDDLLVGSPASGRLAPPGYYLLFVVDGQRIPSVGAMVRLEGFGDPIFADGFETGDTSAWAITSP